ncbi:MAG: bifunctional DNA-formamidopyrimidine glycosylase/DNA-(apurinic or apyrimidinic site) lyase [Acidobacteria bacterium]|nr:MAG: bifunctional DNA-formamidopyrimidine glycosylase/DNA-(apurinic or apyrimidinic site) lyase [Acidobacteriota bacterium]
MPELPEVETVVRQLAPLATGRRIEEVRILDPLLRAGRPPAYRGRTVARLCRRGKWILFELSGAEPLYLACHLRMTGRLLWRGPDDPLPSHLRARIRLENGEVAFVDPRRLGRLAWTRDPARLGPAGVDPMEPSFTVRRLARLLAGSAQAIKPWLLRQDRLCGIGNIYASEILHAARLDPRRAAGTLDAGEVRRLHRATRRVLASAIRMCGTTFSDFQDARGASGRFQELLAVYGRDGRPCRRCGHPVRRIVQQQRSTFFCPACVGEGRRTGGPEKEKAGRDHGRLRKPSLSRSCSPRE